MEIIIAAYDGPSASLLGPFLAVKFFTHGAAAAETGRAYIWPSKPCAPNVPFMVPIKFPSSAEPGTAVIIIMPCS